MVSRIKRFVSAGILIFLGFPVYSAVPVNIAVPSLGEGLERLKQWTTLINAIEDGCSLSLNLIVARDNRVIKQGFEVKNYDLAFVDSFWYFLWRNSGLCREVAVVQIDGTRFRRIYLVSNRDSIFRNIGDLENRSIAFTLKNESAAGFYLPMAMLLSKGINPFTYFKESIFSETFLSILKGTAYGKLDAGFITSSVYSMDSNQYLVSSVRIIMKSEIIPQWILVARSDFNPEAVSKIEDFLLGLSGSGDGEKLLLEAGFSGFTHTSEEDFSDIGKYIKILENNYASPE